MKRGFSARIIVPFLLLAVLGVSAPSHAQEKIITILGSDGTPQETRAVNVLREDAGVEVSLGGAAAAEYLHEQSWRQRAGSFRLSEKTEVKCPHNHQPPARMRATQRIENVPYRVIQLVAVAPSNFSAGKTDEEVITELVATVEASNLYLKKARLIVELSGIQIFRDNDPYSQPSADQNAYDMLEVVSKQWRSRQAPEHDLVVVFGKGRFREVFGLAFHGTSCSSPHFSFLFVTQPSPDASMSATLAHEVGHYLGMYHDNSLYPAGPSLMWPNLVTSTNGFSQASIDQYLSRAGMGHKGGECFHQAQIAPTEDSAADTLAFRNGTQQTVSISEGRALRYALDVKPTNERVFYSAYNLPDGAALDLDSGLLSYMPSYSSAGTYSIRVVARTATQETVAFLTLEVSDVNQAPRFSLPSSDTHYIETGEQSSLHIVARDNDPGERVELQLLTRLELPGIRFARTSGELFFTFRAPTEPQTIPFVVRATDSRGLSVDRQFKIEVRRPDAPPVFSFDKAPILTQSGEYAYRFSVVDPEGQDVSVDFEGLPAGSIVREGQGGNQEISLAYDSFGEDPSVHNLKVRVSDGWNTAEREFKPSLGLGGSGSVLLWPGDRRPSLESDSAFFYQNGQWQKYSCEGEVSRLTDFGGFTGDVPLSSGAQRVVYRTMGEQGFWYLEGQNEAAEAWGLAGDIPHFADTDGDGVADYIVYRPSEKRWYIRSSLSGVRILDAFQPGIEESIYEYSQVADVDGDGKADFVRYAQLPSKERVFFVSTASGERLRFFLGRDDEIGSAVIADFDADGRADLGVLSSQLEVFLSSSSKIARIDVDATNDWSLAQCGLAQLLITSAEGLKVYDIFGGTKEISATVSGAGLQQTSYHQSRLSQRARFADLDGDGKGDLAVYRTEEGLGRWFTQGSLGGQEISEFSPRQFAVPQVLNSELLLFSDGNWGGKYSWGQSGDTAVPADYDGDGRDDLAVYRPDDSTWWIAHADGTVRVETWGTRGNVPVPADYNGDGKADIAIWVPEIGLWSVLYQDGSVQEFSLGNPADIPVPGDYNGDGKAEFALYREEGGLWIISDTQVTTVEQWGLAGDYPIRADLDGDGRRDIAVWRPSNGTWYSRRFDSIDKSVIIKQWGLPGDQPLGNEKPFRLQ